MGISRSHIKHAYCQGLENTEHPAPISVSSQQKGQVQISTYEVYQALQFGNSMKDILDVIKHEVGEAMALRKDAQASNWQLRSQEQNRKPEAHGEPCLGQGLRK